MVENIIGIYKIENIETGIVYIGSSTNIKSRWKTHRHSLNMYMK
jgi:predicted GIY-YIG superfamily endonuclease